MSIQRSRARLRLLIAAAVAVSLSLPGTRGDDPSSTEKQVAKLIAELGAEQFAARQAAEKALVRVGKPALKQLTTAALGSESAEVRRRTLKVIEQIDPGAYERAVRAGQREELRRRVISAKGTDAKNWGESIANPFAELGDEAKKKLRQQGVDVDRLLKMRARFITGNYCGANGRHFVNSDPDTILVIGKGFITHQPVSSLGPILAAEDAHFMSDITGADLVWIVDQALPRGRTVGLPLLVAPNARLGQMEGENAIRDDFGWHTPKDFCKPLLIAPKYDPAPTAELAAARTDLAKQIKDARGVDVTTIATPVANPFTALSAEGKTKLKVRGVDADRLARLKAMHLTGSYFGAGSKTFINSDPDTILIVGKGFGTHGAIFSMGPVLAVENAHFMGSVTGADLVWFVDKSFPRGKTMGAPVILAPTVSFSQMRENNGLVWFGDYGWRAPADFPKPVGKPADKPK